MPLYTYECSCGAQEEHLLSVSARDSNLKCVSCGSLMHRLIDAPVIGKPAYQMKVVLGSGEHVAGHFGKDAKRKP